jgi:hypothetical protein
MFARIGELVSVKLVQGRTTVYLGYAPSRAVLLLVPQY